jgi:hypothetical protein
VEKRIRLTRSWIGKQMESIEVGHRCSFRNAVCCLIWSDGTVGSLPAGAIVTVKGYETDRNFLVADWDGVDVCLFVHDIRNAGIADAE